MHWCYPVLPMGMKHTSFSSQSCQFFSETCSKAMPNIFFLILYVLALLILFSSAYYYIYIDLNHSIYFNSNYLTTYCYHCQIITIKPGWKLLPCYKITYTLQNYLHVTKYLLQCILWDSSSNKGKVNEMNH